MRRMRQTEVLPRLHSVEVVHLSATADLKGLSSLAETSHIEIRMPADAALLDELIKLVRVRSGSISAIDHRMHRRFGLGQSWESHRRWRFIVHLSSEAGLIAA